MGSSSDAFATFVWVAILYALAVTFFGGWGILIGGAAAVWYLKWMHSAR